mmetsp:Transcript_5113/g.15295  ORF Transcript_5113/g.15295 Transcript_5113/m.15295 type:complete len:216 (+) Transcript_5113:41-688(+)
MAISGTARAMFLNMVNKFLRMLLNGDRLSMGSNPSGKHPRSTMTCSAAYRPGTCCWALDLHMRMYTFTNSSVSAVTPASSSPTNRRAAGSAASAIEDTSPATPDFRHSIASMATWLISRAYSTSGGARLRSSSSSAISPLRRPCATGATKRSRTRIRTISFCLWSAGMPLARTALIADDAEDTKRETSSGLPRNTACTVSMKADVTTSWMSTHSA